ncbi:MAG: spondin domain-containing protein [Planctomycetota bacterium]|jgi:hypothetical protein
MDTRKNDRKLARLASFGAVTFACLALLLGGTTALAGDDGSGSGFATRRATGSSYMVTITNLTYDQIISPPVVVVHDGRFSLFQPGQQAGSELAALAEDGMTGPLAGLLEVSTGVVDYAVADGGIPPASSVTVEVSARGHGKLLSLAGMLVSTNDAFVGLDGLALSSGFAAAFGATSVDAPAYDAGSEANTESCDHIPGPPCGSPGVRVTDGAEGFVHVHRGIRGVGDLDDSAKDWNNPVANVTVRMTN